MDSGLLTIMEDRYRTLWNAAATCFRYLPESAVLEVTTGFGWLPTLQRGSRSRRSSVD